GDCCNYFIILRIMHLDSAFFFNPLAANKHFLIINCRHHGLTHLSELNFYSSVRLLYHLFLRSDLLQLRILLYLSVNNFHQYQKSMCVNPYSYHLPQNSREKTSLLEFVRSYNRNLRRPCQMVPSVYTYLNTDPEWFLPAVHLYLYDCLMQVPLFLIQKSTNRQKILRF